MTARRGLAIGHYARAIEGAMSRALGQPKLLSPRDWSLVSDWHARGVPLEIVREAIEERPRGRSRRPPSSLDQVASRVEEAWGVVRAGRTSVPDERREFLPDRGLRVEAWRLAASDAPPASLLPKLLSGLLAELERGISAEEIDSRLDRALPLVCPEALCRRAAAETDEALRSHRSRVTPEVYASTRERSLADRLRASLGLPRLALTRRRGPAEAPEGTSS